MSFSNLSASAEPTSSEFALYTSTRYDPLLLDCEYNTRTFPPCEPSKFFLLPYHRDRLLVAAEVFGWGEVAARLRGEEGLRWLKQAFDTAIESWEALKGERCPPSKVRPVLHPDCSLEIGLTPLPPIPQISLMFTTPHLPPTQLSLLPPPTLSQPPITFVLDPQPIHTSLFTQYKTTSRDHYMSARSRCGLGLSSDHPDEALLWNVRGEVTEASGSNVAFWRGGKWVTPREEAGGLMGSTRRWLVEQGEWVPGAVRVEEVRDGEWVLGSNGMMGCFVGKVRRP